MSDYQKALNEGYQPGSPGKVTIDQHVAEEKPCQECGSKMRFHPLMKDDCYRAFSICPECGYEVEF